MGASSARSIPPPAFANATPFFKGVRTRYWRSLFVEPSLLGCFWLRVFREELPSKLGTTRKKLSM